MTLHLPRMQCRRMKNNMNDISEGDMKPDRHEHINRLTLMVLSFLNMNMKNMSSSSSQTRFIVTDIR